jgi:hypothetical protein
MGVLAAALQYDKDFTWALQRINELGFEVSQTSRVFVEYELKLGLQRCITGEPCASRW